MNNNLESNANQHSRLHEAQELKKELKAWAMAYGDDNISNEDYWDIIGKIEIKAKKLLKKVEKGCGKKFMYIDVLKDERICGKMEDLKHSWNIIYCPTCQKAIKKCEEFSK